MATSPAFELYCLPLLPLITRGLLVFRWSWHMSTVLPEPAQDRDFERTVVLALAGFSFTAVAALAALDATSRVGFQLSVWYALVSFVSYISSLNLQSYKAARWQGQFATALTEMGTLSLMLTVASLIFSAKIESLFQWSASLFALGAWLADHIFKLWIDCTYLEELDAKREGERRDDRQEEGSSKASSQ